MIKLELREIAKAKLDKMEWSRIARMAGAAGRGKAKR